MKSRTSFFNKGIIFDDLKRFGWIGIGYAFVLFLALPLQIIMLHSDERIRGKAMNNLFYFTNHPVQCFLIMIVPVLLGIFLFRYIQVKGSVDGIHSLPIERKVLYRSHVVVGIALLLLPILFIGGTSLILKGALNLGGQYGFYDVIHWVNVAIVMSCLFFFTSVAIGMMVGVSVLQGVLTYIFLVLPLGLSMLLFDNLKVFIYGFIFDVDDITLRLSPLVRLLEGFRRSYGPRNHLVVGEAFIYIAISVALYFLAKFIYEKRRLESAEQSIAFKSLEYIFKYGMTFCSMLLGGLYFKAMQNSLPWTFFGYFMGSFIGYFIAEMVIKKSVRVFKNIKGYAIYIGVFIVVFAGIKSDIIGFERKIPPLDQVEAVYFNNNFYELEHNKDNFGVYSDKKNVEKIYSLHKEVLGDKEKNKKDKTTRKESMIFRYKLKNGSAFTRGYTVSYDQYSKYLKPIQESEEYKAKTYGLLAVKEASDIEKISINLRWQDNKEIAILNPTDIKEAIEILKQEINKATYEEMRDGKNTMGSMRFIVGKNKVEKYPRLEEERRERRERGEWGELVESSIHLSLDKSYTVFEQWCKKKGYL